MTDERSALAVAWAAAEGLVGRVGRRGPDRGLTEIGRSDARVVDRLDERYLCLQLVQDRGGRQIQGWH